MESRSRGQGNGKADKRERRSQEEVGRYRSGSIGAIHESISLLGGRDGEFTREVRLFDECKRADGFQLALLDTEGFLIANAPHIPVHLGALGVCVRSVRETLDLGPGDIVVTNHPRFGGSHLPDITLIASAFSEDGQRIGYIANRAHHAELGGIAPRVNAPEGTVIS